MTAKRSSQANLEVLAYDHVGIRVRDRARSVEFYGRLGFEVVYEDDHEPVVILRSRHGVEINLVVNANAGHGTNVLMDVDEKHAGHTHIALLVGPMTEVVGELDRLGIPLSGGPVWLGGAESCFIRDPDRNVIELRSNHH